MKRNVAFAAVGAAIAVAALPAVQAAATTATTSTSTTIFAEGLSGYGTTAQPYAQYIQGYVGPQVPAGETVVAKYFHWNSAKSTWVLLDTNKPKTRNDSSTTKYSFFSTTFSATVPSSGKCKVTAKYVGDTKFTSSHTAKTLSCATGQPA